MKLTLAATLTALTLAGCTASTNENFFTEREQTPTMHILQAQAATGARSDATLYPVHFDGANLNSLGESKLEMMLASDEPLETVSVYVNVPKDDVADARGRAVAAYLKDRGVKDNQIKLVLGPNPRAFASAQPGLTALGQPAAPAEAAPAAGGAQMPTSFK